MDDMDTKIQKVIKKLFDLYGGKKKFEAVAKKQLLEFNQKWDQDSQTIGRILRSHLVVEHYLTRWLQYKNPNLDSLDDARLTFAQKVDLIGDHDMVCKQLVPGLRKLNSIRNRIAHNLSVDLNQDDKNAFLAVSLFSAMVKVGDGTLFCHQDDEPIDILEGFAKFAGGILQAGSHENAHLWAEAFKPDDEST